MAGDEVEYYLCTKAFNYLNQSTRPMWRVFFIALRLMGKLKSYYLTAQKIDGTYDGIFLDVKYKTIMNKRF